MIISILFCATVVQAQNTKIEGTVYDAMNNEPIPFANVKITGTTIGAATDFDGKFIIVNAPPGFFTLTVSSIGYNTVVTSEYKATSGRTVNIDVSMEQSSEVLEEAVVTTSVFEKEEDQIVSVRTVGASEIENNPGANRDISKVVQSLPGVAATPVNRNDIIVRGGSSAESKFYLDGVEIPTINHFATQGASGGSNGILNADLINEVDFYSAGFPANRGGMLSGLFEFTQMTGNTEKPNFKGSVGASELWITTDGPLTENTTYVASARQSYLQFLFDVIGLPFLPTFNDFQFKTHSVLGDNDVIKVIGLGAIDRFRLNTGIENPDEGQLYILNYLPVYGQWNYTLGGVWQHFQENSNHTLVLSRSMLEFNSYKHPDNDESQPRIYDYTSQEAQNKIRYEFSTKINGYSLNLGANLEYWRYTNNTYQEIYGGQGVDTIDYGASMDMFTGGLFGQVSKRYFNEKLLLSLGTRLDGANYTDQTMQAWNQFSPRLSASYSLMDKLAINGNVGRYYSLPPMTALGYKNRAGQYLNRDNGIGYIRADHLVGGLEYQATENNKSSIEFFYKWYDNYPYSISDSISLAHRPADFGTFGDEELTPDSKGRAYGMELFNHYRLSGKMSIMASYTLVWSEFTHRADNYAASAWDTRHVFILTGTRSLPKDWQVGLKWRFSSGLPYTPYDMGVSSLRDAWDLRGRPYFDYSRVNSARLDAFHQLDIRVDKDYYFDNWALKLYLDIQNFYNFKSDTQDRITNLDENGAPQVDPSDPNRYILRTIESEGSGTVLPTIGIIVEF